MNAMVELGMWSWNMGNDRVVWDNDRPRVIFGLAPGDPPINAEAFVAEFLHPDEADSFAQAVARAGQAGCSFHFIGRIRRRCDGQERWVEMIGRCQPNQHADAGVHMLGTVDDVTDRKLADEKLRLSEAKYRNLFESMDEGYCLIEMVVDAAGVPQDYRFVETNPAFLAQSGLADATGRTIRDLVPAIERHWIDIYGEVAKTGQPRRFVQHSAAMGRWFNVYAAPLGTPGPALVALLFNDVTAQRRTEDELRLLAAELAEADQRKNQFLAVLAHELRNPLAPLRSGLEVLRRAPGDAAALQRTRPMMERQVAQLESLVSDLLDVERIRSGKLALRHEHVDLASLVRAAVETSQPLIDAAGHQLTLDLPQPPLWLDTDPTRIAQVLSNLLNNAARFTPQGGRIGLRARARGTQVDISITDNGLGIEADQLQALRALFAQAPPTRPQVQEGMGLGLSLVQQLVGLQGGQVQVHSDGPGLGSRFCVCLPLSAAQPSVPDMAALHPDDAEQDAAQQDVDLTPCVGRRVLVVDDNRDAGESLALLLELGGHTTQVAFSGPQALSMVQEFQPQLVFLDIGMPGMDGCQVATALRKDPRTRNLFLVALTGWGADDDRARTREAGFDHHITKPADPLAIDAVLLAVDVRG